MTERPTHPNRCDPFNDLAYNSEGLRRRDFARRLTRECSPSATVRQIGQIA